MKIYNPVKKNRNVVSPKIGIYISKERKTVHSQNPGDFVFTPNAPSASIKKRISLKVNTVGDTFAFFVFNDPRTYTAEYKHGFGYTPEVIAFVTTEDFPAEAEELTENYINVPSTWQNGHEGFGSQHVETFDCWADEMNVYVSASRIHFQSMVGVWNLTGEYTFDVLLLMEEAK